MVAFGALPPPLSFLVGGVHASAFRAVDPRGFYRPKLATIVLLANAKEHGFVDSPGQPRLTPPTGGTGARGGHRGLAPRPLVTAGPPPTGPRSCPRPPRPRSYPGKVVP